MIKKFDVKNKICNWETCDYQSIIPDEIESFIIGKISEKAALLNPVHVSGHQPPNIYINSPRTKDQEAMFIALIAPATPQENLVTKIQDKKSWSANEKADTHPMIKFFIWACKYIWIVMENIKLPRKGMNHGEISAAALAMSSSIPRNLKIGVAKMKRGINKLPVTPSTIHDLCK